MSYPISVKKEKSLIEFENMIELLSNEDFYVITDYMNRIIYAFKDDSYLMFFHRYDQKSDNVAKLTDEQQKRMGIAIDKGCEVNVVVELLDVKHAVIRLHDKLY